MTTDNKTPFIIKGRIILTNSLLWCSMYLQKKTEKAYQERRKTPCFSYGNIRRSETKFLLKG